MEVTPADDLCTTIFIYEYQWIISGTVDLDLQYPSNLPEHFDYGAMDLWGASEAVSILNPVTICMRQHDF